MSRKDGRRGAIGDHPRPRLKDHHPVSELDRGIHPYTPEFPKLLITGTLDRVRIADHFYSDKPMVPAILTAAAYRVLMFLGLPRPGERPDVFCWVSTFLTCGLSYAAAVACMWLLGRRAGLTPAWRLVWRWQRPSALTLY